jgi:hypothetical protein
MTLKTVEIVDVDLAREDTDPLSTATFKSGYLKSTLVPPAVGIGEPSRDEPGVEADLRLVDTGHLLMGKRVYIESDGAGDAARLRIFQQFMYPDRR